MAANDAGRWADALGLRWLLALLSRPAPAAILVIAVGVAATLFAWRVIEGRETRIVAERFENVATQLIAGIQQNQGVHDQALRAGAALLSVTGQIEIGQWRSIYDNLRVADRLPGVQGYGFAEAVTPATRAEHVARIRAQGFPHYAIQPAGDRDFYTPVTFVEPFDMRNQRAHGFDMFSDPERRKAMLRSAETGATAATGRVRLMQETDQDVQAGFLLYVPVYRTASSEGAGRDPFPGLMGFVYSPVRVSDFLNSIMRSFGPDVGRQMAVEVFDGADPSPEALIYTNGDRNALAPDFVIQRSHDIFGRVWTVRMSPSRAFVDSLDRRGRSEVLFGGIAISLLAGALAWLVTQRQRQREEAALRNDMITREMSHRVKNLLAVIQSIAARTMSGGRSLEEAKVIFSDRLSALARAHSALVDGRWSGALLRDLLEGELAPFGARVSMSGPPVRLNAQMAQNMAMAVHELATNAAKYGSLSQNAGVVRIAWRIRREPSGPMFSFAWEEAGGPPAHAPEREGFGQTLLRRLIGSSIGSEPVTEYTPLGFRYRFECSLERIISSPVDETRM
ncbi:MAG: CHASE domain-containing protein [Beijerinckiaceae bacterium]|nr:CHASE domain-containing protein [Beijerinckiaceae bacterium]